MARRLSPLVLAVAGVACAAGGAAPAVDGGPAAAARLPPAEGGRPACRDVTRPLPVDPRPADVLVLFDRSASMSTEFGGGTRYSVQAEILGDLVEAYQDKIRFGLQVFPSRGPCADGQLAGCCAEPPRVPVGPGAADAIRGAIEEAAPVGGNTPTAGALRLARLYYASLDDGVAERYVLLSTDGRPSCSAAGRLAEADALDADGRRVAGACHDALVEVQALREAGVKVIVLGVGPGLDADPGGRPGCLDEIAQKGGAPRPGGRPSFFPATDPAELEAALQRIFGAVARPTCTLALSAPAPDPGQVMVLVDGREIPRDREHGWDFDPPGDARRIRIFGLYCRRLERFQVREVEVRFGCPPCADEAACE